MTMPSRPGDPGRAAALASTMAASCHPYTHVVDAAIARHAMTASDLMPTCTTCGIVPNHLDAASVMPPLAGWQYHAAVPPQPGLPSNLHADYGPADSLESHLGSGPLRHIHARDGRNARHSPY